jgi:hypothetical protein
MFRHSAKLIAELTTAHFVSESAETKVLYFFIMHEVMTRSKDAVSESLFSYISGVEFIIAFGDVLYGWV